MKNLSVIAAAAVMFSAAPAFAGEPCLDKGGSAYGACPSKDGVYIGLKGGAVFARDAKLDGSENNVFLSTANSEFDTGWAIGGVLGYEFNKVVNGVTLRPELELGYQENELSKVNGISASGEVEAVYGFANLYADVSLAERIDLVLGGGVGFGGLTLSDSESDVDDTAFGYHLDAGLAYALNPNWTAEATYRYSSFIDSVYRVENLQIDVDDFSSHQALVGLRYKFD